MRLASELFAVAYPDVDEQDGTESPPRAGELTTFRRYMGDPDTEDFVREIVRVHDSGAFSFRQSIGDDDRCWTGRLGPDLHARWSALVRHLDFTQRSPEDVLEYHDRVAVIVERPGEVREKELDAVHPPETFTELVHLMSRWAEALGEDQSPTDLIDVHPISIDDLA